MNKIDYSKLFCSGIESKVKFDKAVLVWIDCNIYSNTLYVLNWVKNFLDSGTIIVFDDYFRCPPPYGENGAYQTFLNKNPKIKSNLLYSTFFRSVFVIERIK